MDPYLEHRYLWPDVHNSLITALRDFLSPRVRPRYYVAIEERSYLAEPGALELVGRADLAAVRIGSGPPGGAGASPATSGALAVEVPVPDEVRETYLEVREAEAGEVVTVVEVLSPTNKCPGEGRRQYEEKRRTVLRHKTHLVEMDLIREGAPMPVYHAERMGQYRILVSRGNRRPHAELFPFTIREPIPPIRIPLLRTEEEPEVDLGTLLRDLYDRAGYDLRIDYSRDPIPPLDPEDSRWIHELLAGSSLRAPRP